jgi:hypothetical protein
MIIRLIQVVTQTSVATKASEGGNVTSVGKVIGHNLREFIIDAKEVWKAYENSALKQELIEHPELFPANLKPETNFFTIVYKNGELDNVAGAFDIERLRRKLNAVPMI